MGLTRETYINVGLSWEVWSFKDMYGIKVKCGNINMGSIC
jgi:hypothetical protein